MVRRFQDVCFVVVLLGIVAPSCALPITTASSLATESVCVGGPPNRESLGTLTCSLARKLKTTIRRYNKSGLAFNEPVYSAILKDDLTATDNCLVPLFHQLNVFRQMIDKTVELYASQGVVNTDHARRLQKESQAIRSLQIQVRDDCISSNGGAGAGAGGGEGDVCSAMQADETVSAVQDLTLGVSLDDAHSWGYALSTALEQRLASLDSAICSRRRRGAAAGGKKGKGKKGKGKKGKGKKGKGRKGKGRKGKGRKGKGRKGKGRKGRGGRRGRKSTESGKSQSSGRTSRRQRTSGKGSQSERKAQREGGEKEDAQDALIATIQKVMTSQEPATTGPTPIAETTRASENEGTPKAAGELTDEATHGGRNGRGKKGANRDNKRKGRHSRVKKARNPRTDTKKRNNRNRNENEY